MSLNLKVLGDRMIKKFKDNRYKMIATFVMFALLLQIFELPISVLANNVNSGVNEEEVTSDEVNKEKQEINKIEELTNREYQTADEPISKPSLEEVVGKEESKENIEYLTVNDKGELMYGDEPLYVGSGNELIPAKLDDLMKKGVKQKLTLVSVVKSALFGKTVSAASGPSIEYRGQVSYGGSIVGDFRVNGEQAFCIEHVKPTPATGQAFKDEEPYNNEDVAGALYYGWGGPENIFGNDKDRGIVVTSLVLSELYNGEYAGGKSISGYNTLKDKATSGSVPNDDVSMYREKLSVSFSGGIQKTQATKFEADQKNNLTFTIPSEVKIVNETTGKTKQGGSVTVKGGDWFHFEASSNFGGKLDTGNKNGSMKKFQPLIAKPESSGYQSLGLWEWRTDPNETVRIQAQFEEREVTMWIDHKDRQTGEKILGEKKTVTIGDSYTASSKTGLKSDGKEAILDDDKSKKGTVPDKNFTVTFYYTTEWDVKVEYKDYQTGETIRKTDTIGTFKVGKKYSFNARADITYNDIAYQLRGSAAKSGTMPRKDVIVTLYYDPYVWVNVWEKNMYPENNVFNHIKERYKVGTTNKFTAPDTHELSGNRVYDLFGNNNVSILTPHNNNASHTFDYKLRRSVTVNYLDNRTGDEVAETKTYNIHEKDKYSESPITIKDGEYTLRYVKTDGDSESGVMGTSNLVVNYYYDKPLIKTGLEKIQIYTAPADEGLPVKIKLSKKYNYPESIADMTKEKIKISLYQGNELITSKEYTAKTLPENLDMKIPAKILSKNDKKAYIVKLEGFNETAIDVPKDLSSITTDGYTSAETTLKVNAVEQKEVSYQGVVMTEREVKKEMKTFYETFRLPIEKLKKIRTGYGFEMPLNLNYMNEIGNSSTEFSFNMIVPEKIVEEEKRSFIPYEIQDGLALVALEQTKDNTYKTNNKTTSNQSFELQHLNVEDYTGNLFSDEQVKEKNKNIKYDLLDGEREFYIPVWGRVGDYPIKVESTKDIGINKINLEVSYNLNVFAHMFAHIDSETLKQDAILIIPVNGDDPFPEGLPKGWTQSDVDWITNN